MKLRIPAAVTLALMASACQTPIQDHSGSANPAHRQAFEKASADLDAGGVRYTYMNIQALEPCVEEYYQLGVKMAKVAITDKDEQAQALVTAQMVHDIVKNSGLLAFESLGDSCVKQADGYYLNKTLVRHSRPDTPLQQFLGGRSAPLTTIDALPESSVLALGGRLHFKALIDCLRQSNPAIGTVLDTRVAAFEKEAGMTLDEATGPIEVSLALTLEDRLITFPIDEEKSLTSAAPGFVLVADLKNPAAASKLLALMKKHLPHSEAAGVCSFKAPQEDVYGIKLDRQLLFSGSRIILSSTDKLGQEALAAKGSLRQSGEWQKLSRGLPGQGTGFTFVSQRFSQQIGSLIDQGLAFAPESSRDEAVELLGIYAQIFKCDRSFHALSLSESDGLRSLGRMRSNLPVAGDKLLLGTATVGIAAAMILPALGQVREKAEITKSKNNLKQIGLCINSYFSDGTSVAFPAVDKLGIDPMTLRTRSGKPYIFLFEEGMPFASVNSPYFPLAVEPVEEFARMNSCSVLFGDGHVESFKGSFDSPAEVVRLCLDRISRPEERALVEAMIKKLEAAQ
ncbi:MAG: hypothetical protein RL095_3840 [Verrucomicrobiota bacterium]|jgi:prepilin-type processing-associated H-X9-DG protein